jgi:hypothetical protein
MNKLIVYTTFLLNFGPVIWSADFQASLDEELIKTAQSLSLPKSGINASIGLAQFLILDGVDTQEVLDRIAPRYYKKYRNNRTNSSTLIFVILSLTYQPWERGIPMAASFFAVGMIPYAAGYACSYLKSGPHALTYEDYEKVLTFDDQESAIKQIKDHISAQKPVMILVHDGGLGYLNVISCANDRFGCLNGNSDIVSKTKDELIDSMDLENTTYKKWVKSALELTQGNIKLGRFSLIVSTRNSNN